MMRNQRSLAMSANWDNAAVRASMVCGQRKAAARIAQGEGFLYVAEVVGTDLIKIGFSLNPKNRIRTLGLRGRGKARLVASVRGTLHQEKTLHTKLRHARMPYAAFDSREFYPRSVLEHPCIPASLKNAAAFAEAA